MRIRGNKAEAVQPLVKELTPFLNDSLLFELRDNAVFQFPLAFVWAHEHARVRVFEYE